MPDDVSITTEARSGRVEAEQVRELTRADGTQTGRIFAGGGEMGSLIRSHDWSATVFGPIPTWPHSLRTAISLMLSSSFAMVVAWGPEYRFFYNDRYRPILGGKHPSSLGSPAKVIFPEAWDFIGPLFERTKQGEAVALDDVLIPLERHGYLENCYFTLSYSPIRDESGEVGGMLAVVAETTERVQSERRLKTLRDLARKASDTSTLKMALDGAVHTLGENPIDVPLALIYSFDKNGDQATLENVSGIPIDGSAAPKTINRDEASNSWPLWEAVNSDELKILTDLPTRFGPLPGGPYPESAHTAVIAPLSRPGQQQADGAVIFGVSPRRALDDQYRGFFELAADHILTAIRNAKARQEERERVQKLVELDRAKTLFFSNVSHEFRTPLTLMLGPLEEMLRAPNTDFPQEKEQLALVHRNGMRLLRLVNTLLDFSRIEAGRVQAVYEATNLSQLTENLASGFRSAVERAGLAFDVDCQPLPEPVYVDRDMWEKIVLNLLSNAFKFTFSGRIAVQLRPVDNMLEFSVSDTGIGISKEDVQRVFERFHRIEGVRARTHEGTGIGLALVQELVKLHGGSVRLESAPGKGSTFTVTLQRGSAHLPADRLSAARSGVSTALGDAPFLEEALRWLPDEESPAANQVTLGRKAGASSGFGDLATSAVEKQRPRILVADDNADMRQYLSHLLADRYEVQTVPDGQAALAAVRELPPELVLSDVMMPNLDGFALVHELRSQPGTSTIPIILLSARAGEESRVEGIEQGADDYLVKPFTAGELLARIATHVKLSAIRREAAEREKRLRAEAELERHRLEELLAQAPAAIGLLSGPEHRWTYVNDLYVAVTGRKSAADFRGKTIRESLPELEGQVFFGLLDEVYRTGKPFFGREMLAKLNRSISGRLEDAYFNFVYQPIRGVDNQVTGILIHAVEVTDQVASRRAIELSEERLRLAQTAAQIGTWEWDPTQNFQLLSGELHDLFGTNSNDPQCASVWASRVFPDDWNALQSRMQEGFRHGSMEFEYRYQHPENGLRWFYCKGRRLNNQTKMIGVLFDITARKQVEETRHRLAAIVESSDDAIISKNLDGIITSWNESAERLFGYTAEEAIGQHITLLIPPDRRSEEDIIIGMIRNGQRVEHRETVRVAKDGRKVEVSLSISPVKDAAGCIIGASKVARDITERRQTELALRESQERLRKTEKLAAAGQLAASLAHEINNPLSSVTNSLFLLKGDPRLDPSTKELVGIANSELARMSRIVKQSLSYYRAGSVQKIVDLGATVRESLEVFSSKFERGGIQVTTRIVDGGNVMGFGDEIRQVIDNLLLNAVEAMPDGGPLKISVRPSQDWRKEQVRGTRLTIADSGGGIPRDILSRIFEPFFTTKPEKGTGLGLWVVRGLVAKHDASIRVRSSVGPGKCGTLISVFWPLGPAVHLNPTVQ